MEANMEFDGGNNWGGRLTVYPLRSTTGRLLIGVTNELGKEFAITVSRWQTERRAGKIRPVEAPAFGIIHNGMPDFFRALGKAIGGAA
jgi:hypothetical protein